MSTVFIKIAVDKVVNKVCRATMGTAFIKIAVTKVVKSVKSPYVLSLYCSIGIVLVSMAKDMVVTENRAQCCGLKTTALG